MITQGSSARLTPETKDLPVDTVVVGIVDQVTVGQASVYTRQQED
ncbi:MAG: EutN/CcmL family microcompartment protein [Pirellulaceae bacterium]